MGDGPTERSVTRRRRVVTGRWAAAVAIALGVGAISCSATTPELSPPTERSGSATSPVDDGTGAAIRRTIAAINATAGGPVAAQRAVLEQTVTASQRQSQRECPPATSTLRFEPAYAALRQLPDDTADGATALLPTLIRIYDGDRIVGTDLTTLRLWIRNDVVATAALCVT